MDHLLGVSEVVSVVGMDLGLGVGGFLVARSLDGTRWKSSSAEPLLHTACSPDLFLTLFVLFFIGS